MWIVGSMEAATRADLLDLPVAIALGGLAVAALLWIGTHRISRRSPGLRAALFAVRVGSAVAGIWFALQMLGNFLDFETPLPLLGIAALGGIGNEVLRFLYNREREKPGVIFALRIGAFLVLLLALLEPSTVLERSDESRRELHILLDRSKSMFLTDVNHSSSELLDFGEEIPGRGALSSLQQIELSLAQMLERLTDGKFTSSFPTGNDRGYLLKQFEAAEFALESSVGEFSSLLKHAPSPDEETDIFSRIETSHDRLAGNLQSDFQEISKALRDRSADRCLRALNSALRLLRELQSEAPELLASVDDFLFAKLPQPIRETLKNEASQPRQEIIRNVLGTDEALFKEIQNTYTLRMATLDEPGAPASIEDVYGATNTDIDFTDMTSALGSIIEQIDSESTAGILLVSDGRHTEESNVIDVGRRLGLESVPVNVLAIGSENGARDAAVSRVDAPDTVYVDETIKVSAVISATSMSGASLNVILIGDGEPLEQRELVVDKNDFSQTLTFSYLLSRPGITDFEIRIQGTTDDAFPGNNTESFAVATSDDRTNVLLLDGYPRWEYRYLRNLFHGRDQSVHLQHVLFRPDQIEGLPPGDTVAASASRPFENPEANQLPSSAEEWLQFDTIIIGDIPPDSMTEEDWKSVHAAVSERGALLVLIAGPRGMPAGFDSETLADLLPTELPTPESTSPSLDSPSPFRLRLTDDGFSYPITQLAEDPNLNARIWAGLPDLRWRLPAGALKPVSIPLAYAEDVNGADLSEDPARQETNALIIARRFGLGRVLLLNFDRTWRLRYGIGDVLHHRFWQNVLQWGGAVNLRSGSEYVRLGTDRLRYEAGDPVSITSRIKSRETPLEIQAMVARDGKNVALPMLKPQNANPWLFDATFPAPKLPGEYTITLEAPGGAVETQFRVAPPSASAEMRDVTLNLPLLNNLARSTGGIVVRPHDADRLLQAFKPPIAPVVERRHRPIWDNALFLGIIAALVIAEWLLRRREGLV
ncbi:MAG: hypothetical protein AAGA58_02840 [Verrucomicrobiota bacterium]